MEPSTHCLYSDLSCSLLINPHDLKDRTLIERLTRSLVKNIQNAGMEDYIQIQHKAFEEQTPPLAPGVMVMNPPYGERQEVDQLREKYKRIGDVLKTNIRNILHMFLRVICRKPNISVLKPLFAKNCLMARSIVVC